MKKLNLSVAVALMLGASSLVASSTSLEKAFQGGEVSGDAKLYTESTSASGTNKDSGFTIGSAGLNFSTASYNGFKANLGFRANHKINEKEDGDYDKTTKAIAHTANIAYANDMFSVTAGRQEIDLAWVGDFHNAVVASANLVENTTLTVGYTNGLLVADDDAPLEAYSRVVDKDGKNSNAYVVDVSYEGISGVVVNPYYLSSKDLFSGYGLNVDIENIGGFGYSAGYAKSSEDVTAQKDGSIWNVEGSYNIESSIIKLGYIKADKDGGVASLASYGDNVNPFDEDEDLKVYATNAKTFYVGVETDLEGIGLGAVYGQVKYDDAAVSKTRKHLDITASYELSKNLGFEALYSNIKADNSDDDTTTVSASIAYSF